MSMTWRRDASDGPPEYPRAPAVLVPESPPATSWCHDVSSGSMPLRLILPRLWEGMITAMTQLADVLCGHSIFLYSVV